MILGGILVTLLCLLSIYNALCMHLGNVKNNEYREEEKIYKFDYKLENNIVTNIESKGFVNLEELNKIQFSRICVYSSYDSLGDLRYDVKDHNTGIPEDSFNYIVFFDKDEKPIKITMLNKRYDILNGRSYREYSKKDSTLKFEKIKETNEYIYKLK
ncbi:TPA: hypothetical protein ACMU2U_001447 [Clostridioides difficile]|nr:hypothetical protein [Clostridioides difficile]MCH4299878.1 hypothetical protein [Clostridioides difficile]MCI4304709.1 hypothetical protein [Clostridioides difficile]MCM4101606.1 hypothetical protein [Clostridioides difficile]MDE3445474.1 hypothetical protein [Clostridioides difficile]